MVRANHLFLTLGTAHVYEWVGGGDDGDDGGGKRRVVSNCHRLPQAMFERRLLGALVYCRAASFWYIDACFLCGLSALLLLVTPNPKPNHQNQASTRSSPRWRTRCGGCGPPTPPWPSR